MRPTSPIVFNNAQATMVSVLSVEAAKFAAVFPVLEGTRFAVKQSNTGSPNKPLREAVITPAGSSFSENGTAKEVVFNLNIYADNFDNLVELGNALETILNHARGNGIRYSFINMGAVQVPEDDETNFHSLITFTAGFAGQSLQL